MLVLLLKLCVYLKIVFLCILHTGYFLLIYLHIYCLFFCSLHNLLVSPSSELFQILEFGRVFLIVSMSLNTFLHLFTPCIHLFLSIFEHIYNDLLESSDNSNIWVCSGSIIGVGWFGFVYIFIGHISVSSYT